LDAAELRKLEFEGDVGETGMWRWLMNCGASLTVEGRRVEVIYRDLDAVEHWVGEASEGRFEIDFEDLRVVPEEVLDLGHQLLVTVEYRGHGSGSGVPVSQRVVQLLEARRGLVVKIEDFTDRGEALEAAGLRE
jgi:hypothetical protein